MMHPGNALAVESWAAVVDRLDADETRVSREMED